MSSAGTVSGDQTLTGIREAPSQARPRLLSVDALRGFAMFWLIGGQTALLAMVQYLEWPWLKDYVTREFEHPPWHGFHWWDTVMPTFIFVSGLTIPLSITRRLEQGEAKSTLYVRIGRRLLVMMVLNVILYGALNHYDWHQMRFMGVLARIALSYSLAAVIVMHATPRRQAAWALGILIGYWVAIALIPVPGFGRGILTPEASLTSYLDRYLLPGQIMGGIYDRLGLYSILPTVSTVLIGALAGHWLLSPGRRPMRKALVLLAAGAVCAMAGMICNRFMPINTKFWSPSYVLAAGGWSLIYLALFYLVIDAWGLRRWAFLFVVIGMNSITIYVLQTPVSFEDIAKFLFSGAIGFASPAAQLVLAAVSVLVLKWLLLCWLYRRGIFLRA